MQQAILVFIEGTICDTRERRHLFGSPEFSHRSRILQDRAVSGSLDCLNELSQRYEIVYLGARDPSTLAATREWLDRLGYPKGAIYLAEHHSQRLSLLDEIGAGREFMVGIGDRWDDNELHLELGCQSIILQEYEGRWEAIAQRIDRLHRMKKITANRILLQGKVEGMARVIPHLLTRFGESLWEAYLSSVLEMAESSRPARRAEDLASFAQHNLDPGDLRDAARWDECLRAEDWQNNSAYGLQTFELVEATRFRYVHKVTSCYYAELWKKHGRPDIGYQIHCRTDQAWWDCPAWNDQVRFEQPKTLMQGDDCCVFIQFFPECKQGDHP